MYLPKVIFLMVLFLYLPLSHANETYGPLRNGETLWTIAPKVKPSDTITRHQMIVALLKANRHAFAVPCNINSLKIKQTLTIPSQAEIEKISYPEALEIYKTQNAAWKAYKRQGVEIECEDDTDTAQTTVAESSTENPDNTLEAMNTQPAQKVAVVNEVAVVNDEVNLPKLSPSIDENAEADMTDPEIAQNIAKLESDQLSDNNDKKISYLPIIIVFGVVLFVLILAFLFRNHSAENKPIPEDLA